MSGLQQSVGGWRDWVCGRLLTRARVSNYFLEIWPNRNGEFPDLGMGAEWIDCSGRGSPAFLVAVISGAE